MKYWFISWTDPLVRFIGFEKDFYDGPIYSIGFWFFHIEYHPWGRPL